MNNFFSLPNIYVVLWALYFTQGTFLPIGSIYSQIVLVLFLSISGYHLYISFTKYKLPKYLKALGSLLLMFSIYELFGFIFNIGQPYWKMIYLSLLPTYSFYIFTKKGQISEKWIRLCFFVLTAVVILQFFTAVQILTEKYGDAENETINVGYELLALVPLLFFWRKKPILFYVFLGIIMAFVVFTVKRGAIIIGVLCTIYLIQSILRSSSRKIKWYVWVLLIVFAVIGIRYAINFFENSEYAQLRLENTMNMDSSGRDGLFYLSWQTFLNSNFFEMIFGYGPLATIGLFGVAAHNDWFEILVDYGLLGGVIYVYYWFVFFRTYRRDKNVETRPVLGTIIIIYFMASLFSMSFAAMTLPANLALGYCLAEQQKYYAN